MYVPFHLYFYIDPHEAITIHHEPDMRYPTSTIWIKQRSRLREAGESITERLIHDQLC